MTWICFRSSFSPVSSRSVIGLTTLQKPGDKGLPFHMVRTDIAGNISKRFSLSRHSYSAPFRGLSALECLHRVFAPRAYQCTDFRKCRIARNIFVSRAPSSREKTVMGRKCVTCPLGLGSIFLTRKQMVYSDGMHLKEQRNVVPIGVSRVGFVRVLNVPSAPFRQLIKSLIWMPTSGVHRPIFRRESIGNNKKKGVAGGGKRVKKIAGLSVDAALFCVRSSEDDVVRNPL